MPALHLTIKPVSSNCNLRCKYCFYHDLSYCRETPSRGLMPASNLETIMRKAFDYADGSLITVSFQGGEPLLAGKEFYRTFSNLISTLNTKRSVVHVAIQTNGVLIDEEWCEIFLKNRYLVGVSIDGDAVTNILRLDTKGNDTFDRTYSALKLLQSKKIDFNVVTVVTKPVANNVSRVYSFFRKNRFKNLHFIL
ncbi:MAG: radical SAM protein [Clostridia bacterium]|nr:radical SAM protein [Clostridia bacterium]